MAAPRIVWRNPNSVKRTRAWTHVRRDERRALYLVLESTARGPVSWEGLPMLEVVRGRSASRGSANETRAQQSGAQRMNDGSIA